MARGVGWIQDVVNTHLKIKGSELEYAADNIIYSTLLFQKTRDKKDVTEELVRGLVTMILFANHHNLDLDDLLDAVGKYVIKVKK